MHPAKAILSKENTGMGFQAKKMASRVICKIKKKVKVITQKTRFMQHSEFSRFSSCMAMQA